MRTDTIAEALGVESLHTIESLFDDEDENQTTDLVAVAPMEAVLHEADEDDEDDEDEAEYEVIESVAHEVVLSEPVHLCEDDKVLDGELGYAQENIKSIIEKGKDAVDDIISIATDSEEAKAYTSVAGLMKTLADLNKTYVDMAIKRNNLRKGHGVNGKPERPFGQGGGTGEQDEPKTLVQNNTVNNNVIFQGSLQEILDKKRELKAKAKEEQEKNQSND